MALGDRLRALTRSRLALRIYLVGLAQMAVVAAGFAAYMELNRPMDRRRAEAMEQGVAEEVGRVLGDPRQVQATLDRAKDELTTTITVTGPEGELIATTTPADAPPCGPRPRPRAGTGPGRPPAGESMEPRGPPFHRPGPGPMCRVQALVFPDGALGRIEFRPTKPPPPPSPFGPPVIAFVLVVVGVSSWLLARSLVRPLDKLRSAARALGAGDMSARTNVDRSDELGEVARGFDEMAGQVTELLKAEKELVANVSHELRTPLARIRVALDLAAEGDAEVAREALADIAGDLEELERLVSDVLTAARLDLASASPRGIPPLRREPVDARELLGTAAAKFRAAHPDRPLHEEVEDALPSLKGDPVLLRRVVDNLLENAHKYTEDPDAPIDLTAGVQTGEGDGSRALVIEVIDRGIGIAPADLSGVFRPFFRVDGSRTRQTGGLGLGLALAKRIVEAHAGSIELVSEPGEGTLARVRIPIGDAPPRES